MASNQSCTLWVGDLDRWIDENGLRIMFEGFNIINCRVVRDKFSQLPIGYGFAEFDSHESANRAYEALNNTPLAANPQKRYRLNWAQYGINEVRTNENQDPVYSLFAGDLEKGLTDAELFAVFRDTFPSAREATIVTDSRSGQSKGYGFVRFLSRAECHEAITQFNGFEIRGRTMKLAPATPKRNCILNHQPLYGHAIQHKRSSAGDVDPENTIIFVGGLSSSVTAKELEDLFSQFGTCISIRIPSGKGCGFVQFAQRECAERALVELDGYEIGGGCIRLSWGNQPRRNTPAHELVVNNLMVTPLLAPLYGSTPNYFGYPGFSPYGHPFAYPMQQSLYPAMGLVPISMDGPGAAFSTESEVVGEDPNTPGMYFRSGLDLHQLDAFEGK